MPASKKLSVGNFIRTNVIPIDMTVVEAAKRLGVGRPALSNLLNGKAALSKEMALRLEQVFSANSQELLDIQAEQDVEQARSVSSVAATSYVPPFLQIKARQISEWAERISSRERLAVFLRTLVNSTGLDLQRVDFAGNDDSQRHGWDGVSDAKTATQWVPMGQCGWEFGTNQDPKTKADGDYKQRTYAGELTSVDRAAKTFVFVTPRKWVGKNDWEKERRKDNIWKDVRAYDASDLEQWLELSIPAQAWLAKEIGELNEGVYSLDGCWERWSSVCSPVLPESLFGPAIAESSKRILNRVENDYAKPIIVSADSVEEGLAYLHCLFPVTSELGKYRDRVVVFEEAGVLTKLASKAPQFIAVATTRSVEKELASFVGNVPVFVIYPRNAVNEEVDVQIDPLNYDQFRTVMTEMGFDRDYANRLDKESGRSPTVLRRRLAKVPAIKTPEWASKAEIAAEMLPFLLAGAWSVNSKDDKEVLSLLSVRSFDEVEKKFSQLLQINHSPLWTLGSHRGVVSKIDMFYAIGRYITKAEIDRFLDIAGLILSEDDPSLDLDEDKRWAANIYGKNRQISATLRDGIRDALGLLAVHGSAIVPFEIQADIDHLLGKLLTPLTLRNLEAQVDNLCAYSEASPEKYLKILEDDIASNESVVMGLIRPTKDVMFSRTPRTGLLWSLENLAWNHDLFARTVFVLARLSEVRLEDNLINKPINSLQAIFRSWMPQTSAPVDQRIDMVQALAKKHPKIAWQIIRSEFSVMPGIGHYSHKPKWRMDGLGYGEPVTNIETQTFRKAVEEMAISWAHDKNTLGDLIESLDVFDEFYQSKIFLLIENWAESGASDEDQCWIREKLRQSTVTRASFLRKNMNKVTTQLIEKAKKLYEKLEPTDLVLKHEWLFRSHWVHESTDGLSEEDLDYDKREKRITALRLSALKEIIAKKGIGGIRELVPLGDANYVIGWLLPKVLGDSAEVVSYICQFVSETGFENHSSVRTLVNGMAHGIQPELLLEVVEGVRERLSSEQYVEALILMPFNVAFGELVPQLDFDATRKYWQKINPDLHILDDAQKDEVIEKLIHFERPRAAFKCLYFGYEALRPDLLYKLMLAVATSSSEPSGTYQIDQHSVVDALKALTKSGAIPTDQLAGLEFLFIDALKHSNYRMTSLERQICENPDWYIHALAFAYKRNNDGEDPEELRPVSDTQRENRAHVAYNLLGSISRIPGTNDHGAIDANKLRDWIKVVRQESEKLDRLDVCNSNIGKLLSKARVGSDGVHPEEPVRTVLEEVCNDQMASGFSTARFNSRGAHWIGEGESDWGLSQQYSNWAKALEITHPRVASIHRNMAATYEAQAKYHETDARLRRRLD